MNMTTKAYCRSSGLSKDQVYNLINNHGFPHIKLGRGYLINDQEADRWFAENEGRYLKGVRKK